MWNISSKTAGKNPTIADVQPSLHLYNVYIPVLDGNITINELSIAIQNNGKGIELDCLDKRIAALFTVKLRTSILALFNCIFNTNYPNEWTKQLLRPEKKRGHTPNDPKLRGIAVSQLPYSLRYNTIQ